ncbi:Putative uncharacterized protein [Lactobacillus helveticus H10]|nr:Putative uncharacterized protein [Lactobacillus helveticus H10]
MYIIIYPFSFSPLSFKSSVCFIPILCIRYQDTVSLSNLCEVESRIMGCVTGLYYLYWLINVLYLYYSYVACEVLNTKRLILSRPIEKQT